MKSDQTNTVDTVDGKPGSGKKSTERISQNIDSVEELDWCLNQESTPGTHKTIHWIAQNIGISIISKTSVHWIVKQDFKVQRFRKRKAQDLTAANKFAHLFRAKQLLRKYPDHTIPFIWFLPRDAL